jgi:hypothetical protein
MEGTNWMEGKNTNGKLESKAKEHWEGEGEILPMKKWED